MTDMAVNLMEIGRRMGVEVRADAQERLVERLLTDSRSLADPDGTLFFALHTHTGDAPWTVIKSDDKKRARLNCIRYFLHSLDYPNKDAKQIRPVDPLIVKVPNPQFKEGTDIQVG